MNGQYKEHIPLYHHPTRSCGLVSIPATTEPRPATTECFAVPLPMLPHQMIQAMSQAMPPSFRVPSSAKDKQMASTGT